MRDVVQRREHLEQGLMVWQLQAEYRSFDSERPEDRLELGDVPLHQNVNHRVGLRARVQRVRGVLLPRPRLYACREQLRLLHWRHAVKFRGCAEEHQLAHGHLIAGVGAVGHQHQQNNYFAGDVAAGAAGQRCNDVRVRGYRQDHRRVWTKYVMRGRRRRREGLAERAGARHLNVIGVHGNANFCCVFYDPLQLHQLRIVEQGRAAAE